MATTVARGRQGKVSEGSGRFDQPRELTQTEAMRFAITSGILFEINRTLLHPLGMAMFARDIDGELEVGMFVGNPGITFDKEVFNHGVAKGENFRKTDGNELLDTRKKTVGFHVQCKPDAKEQRRKKD